jgi:hypothetical protein
MDLINYKPNVGTDYLHVIGNPGWGKTALANMLAIYCLKKGENFIIPGDRFCEWRHFFNYPKTVKKITLIIPDDVGIHYHNFPEDPQNIYRIPFEIIKVDYRELNILDYIPPKASGHVIAIYDAHFRGKTLWRRADLWVRISSQLLDRTIHLEKAIGMIFNEAGILFQQMASDKHWTAVHEFAELLVDFRKGLLRPFFISQIKTEVESTIREKCNWKIFRKGSASSREPRPLQKSVPFSARDEYHIVFGGLYLMNNRIDAFTEIKQVWKMIPLGEPREYEEKQKAGYSDKYKVLTVRLKESGLFKTNKLLAEYVGISEKTLYDWLSNNHVNEMVEKI